MSQTEWQGRKVLQTPRGRGHLLQPKWYTSGAFAERFSQLKYLFEGKKVLDLGCTSALGRPDWIHALIAEVADTTIGVDIDPDGVERAHEMGYDIRLGDAENLSLGELFQVVHAGELIEHLDNPRALLEAARAHLDQEGVLVITTPNPFGISNFVYRIGGRPRVNADHVAWFCEDTLGQLLKRNGFELLETKYLRHPSPNKLRRVLSRAIRVLLPDHLAWNTLVMIARGKPNP